MKPLLLSALLAVSLTSGLNALPAAAAPLVRQVSATQAQGLSGNGTVISVWAGAGTNIDFSQTGETVQRAWIDDPHAVTVDFDVPMSGQNAQGNSSGARIVHLRRVTGISFPNLPQARSTLLTVITQTHSGGAKTYLFEVRYGQGAPQYASVRITPDTSAASGGVVQISGNRSASWNDVQRGLDRAIAQSIIPPTSPVAVRVRSLLALVQNGTDLNSALAQSGVSLAVVARLAEMGYPPVSTPALLSAPGAGQPF